MTSKPGEGALLAMKQLEMTVKEFKTPKVPVARKKKERFKIITEEDYVENLSKIIQRDYFPDLAKMKAQNEYLDAVANNDVIKLRQIFKKYRSKTPLPGMPMDTPSTFETPINQPSSSTPRPQNTADDEPGTSRSMNSNLSTASAKTIISGHSLDSFLDAYTSEDNASFQEIIEAADKKLRQKYAVLFDAERTTAEQVKRALALPPIDAQFQLEAPKTIEMWRYKNENYIMYTPEGVPLTRAEEIEAARRRQEIVRANTRLATNPFNEAQSKEALTEAARSQARANANKVGLDGLTVEASATPQVRGFSFVKSPSPCPGAGGESPLMTWGEIEGTPFRLDGGDTPMHPSVVGPSFRIAENSKRDEIALQLAGAVSEQARKKKEKAMETAKRNIAASPRVRNSFERLATMSPAARRLATAKLGLRATPSPRRTPMPTPKKATPSPLVRKRTPLVAGKEGSRESSVASSTSSVTLTDNLLDIPSKRAKASDFF